MRTTIQPRGVLAAMEPGTQYRTVDLLHRTGLSYKCLMRRLRNLLDQGRIERETRTTRSGHLVLWRLP